MDQLRYFYLTIAEWITAAAILLGPILAVLVTRYVDERRLKKDRQLTVLRSLIKTRRSRLDGEHVAALNLIELEYHDKQKVMESYRKYMDSLMQAPPADHVEHDRFVQKRNSLFAELVQTLGNGFGYTFDKMDLDQGGYFPSGWGNDADRQRKNAELLTEILEGNRPLPIFHLQYDKGKFPPKPLP